MSQSNFIFYNNRLGAYESTPNIHCFGKLIQISAKPEFRAYPMSDLSTATNPCALLEVRVTYQLLVVMLQEGVALGNADQSLGNRGFDLVAHGG